METIEEAALKEYHKGYSPKNTSDAFIDAFQRGANWQKEQMNFERDQRIKEFEAWYKDLPEGEPTYTEEEVKDLFALFLTEVNDSDDTNELLYEDNFEDWFENNKKK